MVLQLNTISVYHSGMACFSTALDAYLRRPENRVTTLAERIGTSQPNVTRYRNGERFPDAETARAIHRETGGEVSFDLWKAEFLRRAGVEDIESDHAAGDTAPALPPSAGKAGEISPRPEQERAA
jgi:transcriptional regulator with XRE-family HTH domain